MIISSSRFGSLKLIEEEVITFPEGIMGFPNLRKFCLVDPGDDTLILWLQSLEDEHIAFPVLEPKVFKTDFIAKLSAQELKQLSLENIGQSVVFSIITIPSKVEEMTANLKAPIVVNLKEQIGKQVVLQENEYNIKHPMFKELRTHLITIASNKTQQSKSASISAVNLKQIQPSTQVRTLV